MRTIARICGILSGILILIIGIAYTFYYFQQYNTYGSDIGYARLFSFLWIVCIIILSYGFLVLLGAWLVRKHPIIAFLIFLIPGGGIAGAALPFYRPSSLSLGQLTPIACGILLLLSCLTAFMGIWEKDDELPVPPPQP